jgi:hypothetical protein
MASFVGSLPVHERQFLARAATFSSSCEHLVAGRRLYRSTTDFEDLWTNEALERVLPHPRLPLIFGVLCAEPGGVARFELVDLNTKARVSLDAEGLPLFGAWAFAPSGDTLAGATTDGKVHLFRLDGKRCGVRTVPDAPASEPGICFANDEVLVFPDHTRAVQAFASTDPIGASTDPIGASTDPIGASTDPIQAPSDPVESPERPVQSPERPHTKPRVTPYKAPSDPVESPERPRTKPRRPHTKPRPTPYKAPSDPVQSPE